MKYILLLLILSSICFASIAQTKEDGLLKDRSLSKIAETLISPNDFHPVPKSGQSVKLMPESVKKAYIERAEEQLATDWKVLPANLFLEFRRTGNRSNYQKIYSSRRNKLNALVLGEYFENKGRFVDEIINGVWLLCEETSWTLPAHMYLQRDQSGLPDITEPSVGLLTAETSSQLAFIYYLFKDKFDEISPLIAERIRYEIDKRILTPNLEREDFWWMGYGKGRYGGQQLNNWTPWVCSNWLTSVLLIEQDSQRRAKAISKIMYSLNKFIRQYPDDGGCDEGPSYWDRNGASLFECLELLKIATKGEIDVFDEQIIKKIGKYIYKVHIAEDYYINFADASAITHPNSSVIYRYGKAIGDEAMVNFASFLAKEQDFEHRVINSNLARTLFAFRTMDELLSSMPGEASFLRNVWLDDLEVMVARSVEGSPDGFYLAAKGGNNGESHNHNDVGNFIIYDDGKPVIIDVGVGTYTAKTFSSERYDIWTMNSNWHSLPSINGFKQSPGGKYKAKDVQYKKDRSGANLTLDLSGAYPEDAKIRKWTRKVQLKAGKNIEISEHYQLEAFLEPTVLNFVTPLDVDVTEKGKVILKRKEDKEYVLEYDANKFTASKEEKVITDNKLSKSWGAGATLNRIKLETKSTALKNNHKISIKYLTR